MTNDDPYSFEKMMPVYDSKCFLVKNLYWNRIKNAIDFAQIHDASIILDIGCNRGRFLESVRKINKNCELWGADIDPKIKNLKIENCSFQVCGAEKLLFEDNYFDNIFALSTLEHVAEIDSAIKEISRILKPNGSVILSSPTESKFYRFCRFILFGTVNDVHVSKSGPRSDADHHFQNVYDIEQKFIENEFKQVKLKSLPGFPFPTLHRVSKFQKIQN